MIHQHIRPFHREIFVYGFQNEASYFDAAYGSDCAGPLLVLSFQFYFGRSSDLI
jgi:hypothetical protein